jgi:hypothetical protein
MCSFFFSVAVLEEDTDVPVSNDGDGDTLCDFVNRGLESQQWTVLFL